MFKICLFLLLSKFKLFYPFQTTTWPRYAPPVRQLPRPLDGQLRPLQPQGGGWRQSEQLTQDFCQLQGESLHLQEVNILIVWIYLTVTKCYERPDCKKLWRKFIRNNFKNNKTQTLIKDPSLKPYCSQGEKDVGELTHRMRRIHLEGNKNRRGEHRVSINQSIIFRERRWNNTSQISKLVNGMSPYIS